jgi:plasmid stabilization system protein ParE
MAPATVSFHRLAAQEYRTARSWYARRSRRAATRFIQAIDKAILQIAENPKRWPLYDNNHRFVKIKKFPYLLLYRLRAANQLTVVAVAHAKRRQGYWRRRTN